MKRAAAFFHVMFRPKMGPPDVDVDVDCTVGKGPRLEGKESVLIQPQANVQKGMDKI